MTTSVSRDELVRVQVLGIPVALWAEARERHEGLLRELSLVAIEGDGDPAAVPSRLIAFGEDLRRRYGAFTGPATERLEAALQDGETHIDVETDVPQDAVDATQGYIELLDEVDAYCREGDLLTLAPRPEVIAFRTWFLGEFVRQLRGESPVPWEAARHIG